jgi:hypothetical protein
MSQTSNKHLPFESNEVQPSSNAHVHVFVRTHEPGCARVIEVDSHQHNVLSDSQLASRCTKRSNAAKRNSRASALGISAASRPLLDSNNPRAQLERASLDVLKTELMRHAQQLSRHGAQHHAAWAGRSASSGTSRRF